MDRYFNRKRLLSIKKLMIGSYILAGVVSIPLIVLFIAGIQDGDTGMSVISAVLLIIFVAEMAFLIISSKKTLRAQRYGQIFEEDHDGVITFERINEMTGYGIAHVKKDIDWLLKAGYLINAVVDDEKVILWNETDFLDIICPTCGAVNQVRFGSSNKCKHCGSYLRRV